MIRVGKIAGLFHQTSMPLSQVGVQPDLEISSVLGNNDGLKLRWDRPHAGGYARQLMWVRHEDLPKLAELLLRLYNDTERQRKEGSP